MVCSVLGTVRRSELGPQLGCETGPGGRFRVVPLTGRLAVPPVAVSSKRETDMLGVHVAGDVVDGLNQARGWVWVWRRRRALRRLGEELCASESLCVARHY